MAHGTWLFDVFEKNSIFLNGWLEKNIFVR
jgi:hypothetical protein